LRGQWFPRGGAGGDEIVPPEQLFLHNGAENGRRIVSAGWVRAATGADTPTDPTYYYGYRYFWWLDVDRLGRFFRAFWPLRATPARA
jgi:hypothetical protein